VSDALTVDIAVFVLQVLGDFEQRK